MVKNQGRWAPRKDVPWTEEPQGELHVVSPLQWGPKIRQLVDIFNNSDAPQNSNAGGRMKPEKAQLVVQGLKEAGLDFTAGVPDAQFIEVYKMLAGGPDIRYVGTANEAEAVGVGFGAWFGGKKPALMLATSGLLVATYHLARGNVRHEVPLLVVIPYRGDIGDPRWLGLYKKTTEPGLDAMDIPYRVVSRSEDIVRTIRECNESARAWLRCIAVILNEEALW